MSGPALFASFRRPGFGIVWSSICLNGYSAHISTVAISWLALEFTGSSIGVGVALAIRILPRLFLAVPIGSMSDKMDRRIMLQATNFFGFGMSTVATIASMQGWFGFQGVLLVAMLVGIFDVAETTLAKSYVYDVVGPDDAVNGLALEQLANKLFGIVGGISTGFLLAVFGGVGAFAAMAVAYLSSGLLLATIPRIAPGTGAFRDLSSAEDDDVPSASPGLWGSVRQLISTPAVLAFAIIALSAEVFAYSSETLAPSFARDILQVGEQGLGNLVAARNAGGVVGVLLLGSVARRVRPERLLPLICIGFGIGLMAFSFSTSYLLSLALMGMVGVAWGSVDALLPPVLQQNVGNMDRGAAVGVWNLSRGFGPLGQLEIGALATIIGIAATQALNGLAFAVTVSIVMLAYRRGANHRVQEMGRRVK